MTEMIDIKRSAGTSIVALVEATPAVVLTDKRKFSEFYEAMKAECDAHVPDLTTEKGRKAIASLAYKVARTKTAIDDAGKALNEEARARINAVDESRREIRAQLDELKDEVRKPLTDWENAEEARKAQVDQVINWLRDAAKIEFDETADELRARMKVVEKTSFPADIFQGHAAQGSALKATALSALGTVAARMDQEEAQRAELERLRAEAAEREERERIKRESEEAERKREAEVKAAAEAKARAEEEQKAREEAAAKAAEQRARDEAEAKARAEREETERAHAEALAAERRRAEEAEAAAAAERNRIEQESADRKRAEERAIAEQAAREDDCVHRGKIMGTAKEAIMDAGPVDEVIARALVLAIAAGNIPNVAIRF